jgi:hypothetical protein
MKTIIRLQLNMAGSANAFCKAHPDPNPAGQAMTAQLDELVAHANTLVQQQHANQAGSTAATERKAVLRDALKVRFTSLVGIAKTAARTEPGVTIHLRLPRGRTNDAAFLALGRVAVAEATARKEAFLKLGMPDDLLDRMTAELDEYDAEIVRQRGAVAAQVGAGAELSVVTQEILSLLKHIDSLHRLRFRDDPELAAGWKSARNVAYPGPGVTPPPGNTQAA